jgi:hypothetical protein
MNDSLISLAQWTNMQANDVFFVVLEPLLVVLAGLLVARLVSRVITRVSSELDVDEELQRFVKKKFSVTDVVRQAASVFIVITAVVVALQRASILRPALKGVVGVLGVLIGIASLLKLGDFLLEYAAFRRVSLPERGESVRVGCVSGRVARKRWLCVEVDEGSRRIRVPYRYVRRQLD